MQEINAWLHSNKDFEKGKALYIKYGSNSFFKTLLNSGPTPYNLKKLGAELKALAPAPPAIKEIIPPLPSAPVPKKDMERYMGLKPGTAAAPERTEVHNSKDFHLSLALKEQLKNYYRQLERNMTELDLCNKESLCFIIAKQIIALDEKIKGTWALLDHYDEHGKFPEIKQEIIRTPAEEIQLLRQSTSKAKTRLKSGNCRDVKATHELIAKNNKRIIELGGKVK